MVTRRALPSAERIVELLWDWPDIELMLEAPEAFALIGQLQIALRHPQNRGVRADVAVRAVQTLKAALPREAWPVIDQQGF